MSDTAQSQTHDPAAYASRSAAAWDWLSRAIDAQQDGVWVLDEVEWQVLADVRAATNALHGGHLPPHTREPVHVRVGRLANWAGVCRLAARAGGWQLFPVAGTDASAATGPVGMADLLSGIYALAEQGERWKALIRTAVQRRHAADRAGEALPEQSLEARLNALHPGFERDLADAEAFFTGPGSLEDLHLFFY
ncbi:hypothetical protein [Streptomyces lydicus]|uniref:hypothetical protein n=1 Tax=Streptomyces lydicus TaxID=47763 RepID=UPI003698EC92